MSYRLHSLYKLARLDYMERMHTLDLICTVVHDKQDGTDWIKTLTEIKALPAQVLTYDAALGQGRN